MFTGIITAIGKINQIQVKQETIKLTIDMQNLNTDYLNIGDSIAVNGVCLTATKIESNMFWTDVMPETFKATNLKYLTKGSNVNLERALAVTDRLNGHFVTGHVDCVTTIIKKNIHQNAINFFFKLPPSLKPYIIPKGSIALDGTSLTITQVNQDNFAIAMIPHSVKHTVLGLKNIGDYINVETDLLAKYILNNHSSINQTLLNKYNF